jgi:hypothetical protein
MSDESCFTPADRANAGNSTLECVEYQVLVYDNPTAPPSYDPDTVTGATKREAFERSLILGSEGVRTAVVEKTTTVTSRIVWGPFEGTPRA